MAKATKAYQCNECDKKMTYEQAKKAMAKGCSCGGYDIDIAPLEAK